MHLFLTFSAALGIARKSSALRSLARKLAAARHSPSKLGLCAHLAQTFVFNRPLAASWERTEIYFLARALRIIFPEKPFNPALIRTTACNQTGCECIVCTSNPSLMMGVYYPEIGLYTCNVCAWKALQSVAMVTGDEVLGRNCCSNPAWKAVRLWR